MAEGKYPVKRSNLHDLRQQLGEHLSDVDDRIESIEQFVGAYRFDALINGTPIAGFMQFNNADPTLVTELAIHKLTQNSQDASPFLASIDSGDEIQVLDGDAGERYTYTATAEPTLIGNVFNCPVSFTSSTTGSNPAHGADLNVAIDQQVVWDDIGNKPTEFPPEDHGHSAPGDGGTIPHSVLTGVGADDHHPQIHDHNTHTNIGPDDHHNRAHNHSDPLDGALSHTVLNDVNPDDHHNRLHNHSDPLDGFVDHDSLTNVSANQHHNQAHLLNGPDHTDVASSVAVIRQGLHWRQGNDAFALEFRMNWRNTWGQQTYYTHDVVRDGSWTMVANKETTDRAAPLEIGSPLFVMPDVPLWANFANTSVVGSGHLYDFQAAGEVRSIRVWPPVTGADITYRLTVVLDGDVSQQELTTLTAGEWNILGTSSTLVGPGSQLLIYLEAVNSGGTTQVTGGWRREANSNAAEPTSGGWLRDNNNTQVRINFTDLDTIGRQAELEGIIVGSTIQFVETASPQNNVVYRVINPPVTLVNSVQYDVVQESEGVGLPTVGQNTTMTADVPVPQSTDYVGIVNGWVGNEPAWVDVSSFLAFDGVDQGVDPDNQYGVDIAFQQLSFSPDWDALAQSSGASGGGGGGGTPFPEAPIDGQTYGRKGDVPDWIPVYTKSEANDALLAEAWATGLIDGGELNIAPTPADIEVIAGLGVVVDSYTDPDGIPVKTFLSWNTINATIGTAGVAGDLVYYSLADGAVAGPQPNTNLGVLVERVNVKPTPAQIRDEIFLGLIIHNGTGWGEISSPVTINNIAHTFSEFTNLLGPTFIDSGGETTEAALHTLDRAAGVVWERNRNWHVNKKDPNRESFGALSPVQFKYVNRDFTDVGALISTTDPTQWDDNGTVSPVNVAAMTTTIQRLYVDPRDNYWILWGQNEYASFDDAARAIGADAADTVIPEILQESILLGFIISTRNSTDWADGDSRFYTTIEAVGGGGGGAGATTFDALTDTPSDKVGASLQVLRVDAGETAIEYAGVTLGDFVTTDGATPLTANWDTGGFGIIVSDFVARLTCTINPTTAEPALLQFLNQSFNHYGCGVPNGENVFRIGASGIEVGPRIADFSASEVNFFKQPKHNSVNLITEAPIDGSQYARKDAGWEIVAGGGGGGSFQWLAQGTGTTITYGQRIRVGANRTYTLDTGDANQPDIWVAVLTNTGGGVTCTINPPGGESMSVDGVDLGTNNPVVLQPGEMIRFIYRSNQYWGFKTPGSGGGGGLQTAEGFVTPQLNNITASYFAGRIIRWVRVGETVTLTGYLKVNGNVSGTLSNQVQIGTLPYNVSDVGSGSLSLLNPADYGVNANANQILIGLEPISNYLRIRMNYDVGSGTDPGNSPVLAYQSIGTNCEFQFSATYRTQDPF
jgi:hypothetical protein